MKTVKDWVEGLHKKADVLFNLVSAIEARLTAVEAGICLVPFSPQDPRIQFPSTSISSIQLPDQPASPQSQNRSNAMITSMSSSQTTTSISPSVQLESSTKKNPQSTPIRLTPQPPPLPSISPIVSKLPQETARKLKKCRQNISSRKKYTRKCLEELFSADELATSNVSGTSGKDKLDECKIGLISRK